jgi:hypothetical protein
MYKCKDYQTWIKQYDRYELSLKQEESFVKHINSCPDCREELEIYYIYTYGINEDDNDDAIILPQYKKYFESYDFTGLVDRRLKDSEHNCNMEHRWNRASIIRFIYVNACMALLMIMLIFIL